jgi:hypothetical protein
MITYTSRFILIRHNHEARRTALDNRSAWFVLLYEHNNCRAEFNALSIYLLTQTTLNVDRCKRAIDVAAFQKKFLKNTSPGRQGGYPSKSLQTLQGVYDVRF